MIKVIIFDWFGVCAERWIDVLKRELPSNVDFEVVKIALLEILKSLWGEYFRKGVPE